VRRVGERVLKETRAYAVCDPADDAELAELPDQVLEPKDQGTDAARRRCRGLHGRVRCARHDRERTAPAGGGPPVATLPYHGRRSGYVLYGRAGHGTVTIPPRATFA